MGGNTDESPARKRIVASLTFITKNIPTEISIRRNERAKARRAREKRMEEANIPPLNEDDIDDTLSLALFIRKYLLEEMRGDNAENIKFSWCPHQYPHVDGARLSILLNEAGLDVRMGMYAKRIANRCNRGGCITSFERSIVIVNNWWAAFGLDDDAPEGSGCEEESAACCNE